MHFLKSVATVGGFTLLSRVFGLVRDMAIAAFLGADSLSDTFFVAFKFPNFFRRLFGEGALNAAFVPLFTRIYTTKGLALARQTAEQIFMVLLTALVILVAVVELSIPLLMHIIAPGFVDHPEKFQLAKDLTHLTFPYILFVSLAAFYSGILNSLGKYSVAAATPVLLNLAMIAALGIAFVTGFMPVWALAWSVVIAGVLQTLFVKKAAEREGIHLRFVEPALTPPVRKLLKSMLPGALAAGIMQINLFVDTLLASKLDGGISYLYYADRLNQFPLSLLGIGISTVLLPVLAGHFEKGEKEAARNIKNRTIEYALALTWPACFALVALAEPIITLIYQRAAFTAQNAHETAKVLAVFSCGLPAYVLIKILSTTFFAQYKMVTPVVTAVIAMLSNIILNLILIDPFGYVGIAAATAITAWLNAGILAFRLHYSGFFSWDQRLKTRMPRIVTAALFMAFSLYYLNLRFPVTAEDHLLWRCLHMGGLIISGMTIYGLAVNLLRGCQFREIYHLIKHRNINYVQED